MLLLRWFFQQQPAVNNDQPLPQAPQQPGVGWTWQYNLNLIGQDKLPTGQQVYDLTQGQLRPSDQVQLHNWDWRYNLNLIGKDQLPTGASSYDLTQGQKPPPPENLKRWEWQYNPNLIGQDNLPNRQQDWPNPYPVRWYQDWSQNLAGALKPPFYQTDWPLPNRGTDPDWRRSWEARYNLNLIGQDRLPNRQQDWPNPTPVSWYKDWYQALALLNTQAGPVPFVQSDWPLPGVNPRLDQFLGAFYNRNLIGLDQLPNRQQDWPLPGSYPRLDETYVAFLNQNLPPPVAAQAPFRQQDWPNPISILWSPSWQQSMLPAMELSQVPFYMVGLFSAPAVFAQSGRTPILLTPGSGSGTFIGYITEDGTKLYTTETTNSVYIPE